MRSWAILAAAAACTRTGTPSSNTTESADSGSTVAEVGACGGVVPGDPHDECCTVIDCRCEVAVLCDAGGCGSLAERLAETPPDTETCMEDGAWSTGGAYHLRCTLAGAPVDVVERYSEYYTSQSWVYAADGTLLHASFGSDVNELCDETSASLSFGLQSLALTDCCEVRDPSITVPSPYTTTGTCIYAGCPAR